MNWKRTRLETIRVFDLTDVPDLADTSSDRRVVIRPRTVTLYQEYGTTVIRGAVVEGVQVRRDGTLPDRRRVNRLIAVGRTSWYNADAPDWLLDLVEQEGLTWLTDRR